MKESTRTRCLQVAMADLACCKRRGKPGQRILMSLRASTWPGFEKTGGGSVATCNACGLLPLQDSHNA